jgi:hypothetical protein
MHYKHESQLLENVIDNSNLSEAQRTEAQRLQSLYVIAAEFENQLQAAIQNQSMTSEAFRLQVKSDL